MDKREKLKARPIEEDTLIINQAFVQFKELEALFERWSWDGITASSLVLLKEDTQGKDKEGLINSLFEQMQLPRDPNLTSQDSGEYLFLNFNFSAEG